jgi:hypothetical protein
MTTPAGNGEGGRIAPAVRNEIIAKRGQSATQTEERQHIQNSKSYRKEPVKMNNTLKSPTSSPEPITFTHKIGSAKYQVNIRFDRAGKESLEEKILRMMKNDLRNGGKNVKIEPPQADWLPERGSV